MNYIEWIFVCAFCTLAVWFIVTRIFRILTTEKGIVSGYIQDQTHTKKKRQFRKERWLQIFFCNNDVYHYTKRSDYIVTGKTLQLRGVHAVITVGFLSVFLFATFISPSFYEFLPAKDVYVQYRMEEGDDGETLYVEDAHGFHPFLDASKFVSFRRGISEKQKLVWPVKGTPYKAVIRYTVYLDHPEKAHKYSEGKFPGTNFCETNQNEEFFRWVQASFKDHVAPNQDTEGYPDLGDNPRIIYDYVSEKASEWNKENPCGSRIVLIDYKDIYYDGRVRIHRGW